MGLIAGADTLQERDLLRPLPVRRTLHVTVRWAGGAQQSLELNRSDHVGEAAPAVLRRLLGLIGLVARGQDNRAHLDVLNTLHGVVVDGVGLAGVPATQALRADAAGQATGRLCLG